MKIACPICYGDFVVVYKSNNLTFSYTGESYPFSVSVCNKCGFVFQDSAYSDEYDSKSENNYSVFNKNENFLFPDRKKDNLFAVELISNHAPQKNGVNVLEIGSNRGDLLYLIKEKIPSANVIGIEPTYFDNLAMPTIHGFFSSCLFSNKFDVVVLQHVLEHIKNPKEFLVDVRKVMAENSILYVEVPEVETTLRHMCEDFTLEHVSYFSPVSLKNCCNGFDSLETVIHTFLHAVLQPKNDDTDVIIKQPAGDIIDLFTDFNSAKGKIISEIKNEVSSGKKVVFYGSSAYFRIMYRLLKNEIGDFESFFYDDNNIAPQESCFGLKRVETIDNECVVVICSNNWQVQQLIKNRLLELKDTPNIVIPWSGFVRT